MVLCCLAEETIFNYGYIPGRYTDLTDKDYQVKRKVAHILNQTQEMFTYKGLPETIKARDAELLIQTNGFGCVTAVNGDLYCIFGAMGGMLNQNYMPTIVNVTNPYLNFNKTLKIDDECIVIPNDSMYEGLLPYLNTYCSLIVEGEITLRLMNILSRQQRGILCPDDETLKSAQAYLDNSEAGKLGVISDTDMDMLNRISNLPAESVGGNAITQIIECIQYQKANIQNFIGLDAIFNMKKEAINEAEAAIGGSALLPYPQNMLKCRKEGWEKVNDLYGTSIEVDFSDIWKRKAEEVEQQMMDEEPLEEEVVVDDVNNIEDGGETNE